MFRVSTATSGRLVRCLFQVAIVGLIAQTYGCASSSPATDATPVALEGVRPNGVAVDTSNGAVYLTDDAKSSVLRSSDGRTFAPYASIPQSPGQGISLSQITFDDARNLLAVRFGFGSASAVFDVKGADGAIMLSGPNPARRRLGIAAIGSHQALSTWFVKEGSAPATGGVSLLTYDTATGRATERDLITGMGKPVGVVVSGDTVFVSDQARNVIVRASLANLLQSAQTVAVADTFAKIENPDLMAGDGRGALYTHCKTSSICKVAPDGSVNEIATDFHDARGVAADPARHRLYVVDRAAAGGTSYLRILPLR
ncbi:hypothetical protein [Paraburkholderia sp. PGU16]|uniref:Uncharacterized protein n=1 Tax=Paraburkholderia largidicola TaxID=3014751 RepID=A0A7I8BPP9_9BURK|nr:hypothetical protein [Paraburkholderia sp. PGU16]BCF90592.1 hypothetical protein PPGU16_36590 [Paraburkholderia sp. PGU16]BEU24390.1 hypothetical protein PBP221_45300 [Paraburkholderia sp. 22B1P]